jgi:hypothetical protein
MDSAATVAVGTAVLTLTQMAKRYGFPRRWAPLLVFGLSALGIGMWAYSQGGIERIEVWEYFVAWVATATLASGAYETAKWATAGKPADAEPLPALPTREAERLTEKIRGLGLRDTEILVDRELAMREHGRPSERGDAGGG